MRVARERMLCIVTPGWPEGELAPDDPRRAALFALFEDMGVIHFASLALLPPRPGEPEGTPPSLLLELVVDEGLRPEDLLQRLAFHPSQALLDLHAASLPTLGTPGERRVALQALLRRGLSVAEGAFTGPRDLSVAQVRAHRELALAMREQAATVDPAVRQDRTRFAAALAQWARQAPQFEAIATPAPASFWRASRSIAKLRALAMPLVAAALALVLMRVLARFVIACLPPPVVPGSGPLAALKAAAVTAATALDSTARWLLEVGARGLIALLLVLVGYLLLFVVCSALLPAWRRWHQALDRTLASPGDSHAARTSSLFGWLLLPWMLLLALGVACGAAGFERLGRLPWIGPALLAHAVLVGLVVVLLVVGLARRELALLGIDDGRGDGILARWRAGFRRSRHATVPQAQQVHERIERCEADVVAGTAHMISLTEVRSPRGWSAWCMRRFLHLLSCAAHVFFTEGRLGDLRGIQYGHWHLIDGGRRFLFFSNYDGNFAGYLDDFIKGASTGTTLAWRWTELLPRPGALPGHPAVNEHRAFPPTRLLSYRGVKCEQAFKAYARASMLPHVLRYDACGLSGQQKIDERRLRDALFGERHDAHDDLLMRMLER